MERKKVQIQHKTVAYRSDGQGRDNYINFNSGGIQIPYKKPTFFQLENRTRLTQPKQIYYRPFIPPKVQHYKSDGTGRDKYIVINDGGFIKSNKQDNFFQSLRSYPSLSPTNQSHIFNKIPYPSTPPPVLQCSTIQQRYKDQQSKDVMLSYPHPPKVYRSLSPVVNRARPQIEHIRYISPFKEKNRNHQIDQIKSDINLKTYQDEEQENQVEMEQPYKRNIISPFKQQISRSPKYPIASAINNQQNSYLKQMPKLIRYVKQGQKGYGKRAEPIKKLNIDQNQNPENQPANKVQFESK